MSKCCEELVEFNIFYHKIQIKNISFIVVEEIFNFEKALLWIPPFAMGSLYDQITLQWTLYNKTRFTVVKQWALLIHVVLVQEAL